MLYLPHHLDAESHQHQATPGQTGSHTPIWPKPDAPSPALGWEWQVSGGSVSASGARVQGHVDEGHVHVFPLFFSNGFQM